MAIISLEGNRDYIDSHSIDNPVEHINSEIDRSLLLDKFKPDERRIIELLEDGYEISEIADKMGIHKEIVRRKYRHIKVLLGG